MTYPQRFNPKNYPGLEEHLRRIEGLSPGQRYVIQGFESPKQLTQLRYQLYAWVNANALGAFYRISVNMGFLELVVTRRGVSPLLKGRIENAPLPARLEEILKTMIGEREPKRLLDSLEKQGEISPTEKGLLLDRYGRVMEG